MAKAEPRALKSGHIVFFCGDGDTSTTGARDDIFFVCSSHAVCICFASVSDANSSSSVDKSLSVSVARKPRTNNELSHQKKAMLYGPLMDSVLVGRLLTFSSFKSRLGRASSTSSTSLRASPTVATAANAVFVGCCKSHNVRTTATSNKAVNDKNRPSTIDGRRLRVCSAYDSTKTASAATSARTAAGIAVDGRPS